ncbi:MAG: DUF3526 domain-containing protein [Gammaproteobacteria bacterium]
MQSNLSREWWFFLRDRQAVATIIAAFLLAIVAVGMGLVNVAIQQDEITSLRSSTEADLQAVLPDQPDPGSASYYSFRLAVDPPSELAFAARGVRDQLPWKHRLRLLALEGQIYENDTGNPELGQTGRIDYAFLISVLAPLLVILLLHDVVDAERRHNRLDLLAVTAGNSAKLVRWRSLLRSTLLALGLLLPFIAGALWSGASAVTTVVLIACTLTYILVWSGAVVWIAKRTKSAATAATLCIGLWTVLVLIVPLSAGAVAERTIDVPQGGDILLQQREVVNRAWDLPEEVTMERFVGTHPEWSDYTEIGNGFEWKWYYAFQQVGDESVAELSKSLREGVRERDDFMGKAAWLSPPLLVDRLFTRLARTDIAAFQRYDRCARDYHAYLRKAHYPMIFEAVPFNAEELLKLDSTRECS